MARDSSGRTVAVIGGGALLLFLLFRGKGWGLGGSGAGDGGTTQGNARCRVRIDADGLELDGARADLPTVVAGCKAAGRADVVATGAAIVGVIAGVVRALRAEGVSVYADPSVWDVINSVPETKR